MPKGERVFYGLFNFKVQAIFDFSLNFSIAVANGLIGPDQLKPSPLLLSEAILAQLR